MQTSLVQSCTDQRWMRGGGAAVWEEASERRHRSSVVVHLTQGCVSVRVSWLVSHWQLQQEGQWPDCLCSAYGTTCLMGLNRNPVAVLLPLHLQITSSSIRASSTGRSKGKSPPNLLCKGWNRLNPLGLNNLWKNLFFGNGCFHIFVLETAEASHRVWVSVLVCAVHAGSKSQA